MLPGISKKSPFSFADAMLYAAIALKHIRLMVLLVAFSLTLGLTYYVWAKPLYYSKSLVNYDVLQLPVDTETLFRDTNTRSVLMQLRANRLVEKTAARMGVDLPYQDIVSDYLPRIVVKFNVDQNIEIEVFSPHRKWVEEWTPLMIEEFIKERDQRRMEFLQRAAVTLSNEVAAIRVKVESAMDQRYDLKNQREVTETLIELNRLKAVPVQLVRTDHQLNLIYRVEKLLENPKHDTVAKLALVNGLLEDLNPVDIGAVLNSEATAQAGTSESEKVIVVPSKSGPTGQKWRDKEKELRMLNDQIEQANLVYLPAHPIMLELQGRRYDVTQQLNRELDVMVQQMQVEKLNLEDQKKRLREQLPQYTAMEQKDLRNKEEVRQKDAGQNLWKSLYTQVANKFSQLTHGIERERVNIYYEGFLELRNHVPVSPHRLKLVLASLALGLMLAIGVPFLIEFLDHTVTNLEQMENDMDLRGLGVVPKVEGQSLNHFEPLALLPGGENKELAENFRMIRANLLLGNSIEKAPQVIMVASAMPQEGKTTVALSLAVSFAQMGDRTIILDADLRRGRINRMVKLPAKPGLHELLAGQAKIEEVCLQTDTDNLDVMPCGERTDRVSDYVGKNEFQVLLESLKERYDKIIIDTPPVLGLSETSIIQRFVDGVVFVVWSGRTPHKTARTAIDQLRRNGAKFLGVVLNRLDLNAPSNYYYYYYYSNQYYDHYREAEKT